jgi:hypothetical protein
MYVVTLLHQPSQQDETGPFYYLISLEKTSLMIFVFTIHKIEDSKGLHTLSWVILLERQCNENMLVVLQIVTNTCNDFCQKSYCLLKRHQKSTLCRIPSLCVTS